MNSRFSYVWQHFKLVYHIPENIEIGYDNNNASKVRIEAYTGNFFEGSNPWPEEIIWKNWLDQDIPLFFSTSNKNAILADSGEEVLINYDIISSAFYLLSGWQEYYAPDRDKYGRFPYQISIQQKLNIVTIPVVNYYFDILKTAIEKAYQIKILPKLNSSGTLTTCITHDIDNSESGWKAEGKEALKKGNIFQFLNLLQKKISGKDVWFNWLEIANIIKKHGAKSTFFFLCTKDQFEGLPNADYAIQAKKYQSAIEKLINVGSEIGVHGSLKTYKSATLLKSEAAKLKVNIKGNRFHFLHYEPRHTPTILEEANITYDSTLGFAEHFGFRNSYCFPFHPYNFSSQTAYNFLEIPLNLMDATLHHPNYLQLSEAEIVPTITPMIQEIRKFGGCFTLLWHNENFSAANTKNGLSAILKIMTLLQSQNSNFKTGSEIHQLYTSNL